MISQLPPRRTPEFMKFVDQRAYVAPLNSPGAHDGLYQNLPHLNPDPAYQSMRSIESTRLAYSGIIFGITIPGAIRHFEQMETEPLNPNTLTPPLIGLVATVITASSIDDMLMSKMHKLFRGTANQLPNYIRNLAILYGPSKVTGFAIASAKKRFSDQVTASAQPDQIEQASEPILTAKVNPLSSERRAKAHLN